MSRVVLTAADHDGWWWACPVTPVSLHGPVVSVRLPAGTAFGPDGLFALHVLEPGQEAVAEHFATRPTDFTGIAVECGFGPVPLLHAVPTRLTCRALPAGEPGLVVGELVEPGGTAGTAAA
jgi:hypothetical protein